MCHLLISHIPTILISLIVRRGPSTQWITQTFWSWNNIFLIGFICYISPLFTTNSSMRSHTHFTCASLTTSFAFDIFSQNYFFRQFYISPNKFNMFSRSKFRRFNDDDGRRYINETESPMGFLPNIQTSLERSRKILYESFYLRFLW
jgi:hypothetical protein